MNADERRSLEQTGKLTPFCSEHPICAELDKLGLIPPRCTHVTIDLPAWEVPVVRVEAYGGPELSRWIEKLREAKVEVTVVEER